MGAIKVRTTQVPVFVRRAGIEAPGNDLQSNGKELNMTYGRSVVLAALLGVVIGSLLGVAVLVGASMTATWLWPI